MDSIKDYGSDSSNSDQDKNNEDQAIIFENSESATNLGIAQDKSHPAVSTEYSKLSATREDSQKLNSFNMFGIDYENRKMTQGQSTSCSSWSEDQSQKSRKIQTSYGELEIPTGDFWKEFTPDEITEVEKAQTSHAEYFKHQTSEHLSSETDSSQNNINMEISTLPHSHYSKKRLWNREAKNHPLGPKSKQIKHDFNNHSFRSSTNKSHQYSNNDDIEFQNHLHGQVSVSDELTSDRSATSQQEMRKLYCVHSKVAPYLHIHPVCRCPSKQQMSWAAHESVVNRLQWNVPNFSHLLLTAGMDATVQVWNVWSSLDQCKARLTSHKKAVKHAEWCQQGRKIMSCSFDRTAQLTDVETGKVVAVCEHISFVTAGCAHPANPSLYVTGTENMILMWDVRTPEAPVKHFSYKDKFGQVQDLLFIKENQQLISCSDLVSRDSADRGIIAWDVRSGVVLSNQIFQERYTCTRLKLHPNKSQFLAQTQGDYIAIFSTSSPYKMDKSKRYGGHKMQGYGIGFDLSSDGSLVYSGSAEGGIHCYDQRGGRRIKKLPSGQDVIIDVACHPVLPSIIASCTWGGRINLSQ